MMVDFICKNHGYQLGNAGKDQISMESFLILSTASCKAEIFFDVIDIPFNSSPNLIGVIPFISSADGSGIGTQVFFRIDINHAAASGGSAGIIAETFSVILLSHLVIAPFHFWADELEGRNSAP